MPDKPNPEPVPFPAPFAASRQFIEQMNAENEGEETYSREGLEPEIKPRSPAFGNLGGNPDPAFQVPDPDPIQFLIDRVDRVIEESVQMGPEPLSTKASVLAALYQAQALREIADSMGSLEVTVGDISRTMSDLLNLIKHCTDIVQDPDYPALRVLTYGE